MSSNVETSLDIRERSEDGEIVRDFSTSVEMTEITAA
jgi:hypothetical protein